MKSVLIGQIVNVHGIKGEVKVYPYTDDVDNLSVKMKKIYLDENGNQIQDETRIQNKSFPEEIGDYKKEQVTIENVYYIKK